MILINGDSQQSDSQKRQAHGVQQYSQYGEKFGPKTSLPKRLATTGANFYSAEKYNSSAGDMYGNFDSRQQFVKKKFSKNPSSRPKKNKYKNDGGYILRQD